MPANSPKKSKVKAVQGSKLPLATGSWLLVLAIFVVYWRVLQNGFVNFDDDIYVTANQHIQDGLTWEGLRWAFTSVSYVYFQPVTWISHMLDVSWFGLNPAGHHMVSVILHAFSAVLLLLWLVETTGAFWRSLCASALFALHPLRVESVAWAAERKDVLSTFFLLASLFAYSRYAKAPSRNRYLLAFALFTLGLLTKPILVAAPFLLLLADYWPLRRPESISRLLKEKIPFILLASVVAALTYLGQQQAGAMRMLDHISLLLRIENASISYSRYLGAIFWPHPLTVLYPYSSALPLWRAAFAAGLLTAITIAAVRARRIHPYLLFGWLWFTVALLPVIGLVQVGMQAWADRFSYVPSIGFLIAVVWGTAELSARLRWPPKLPVYACAAALVFLSLTTWIQLGYWSDSVTLFQHAVENTGPSPWAEQNLGSALGEANRNAEALPHLARAVQLQPDIFQAQYNLGKAQASQQQIAPAIDSFSQAIRLKPDYAEAYYARAVLLQRGNQPAKAAADLRSALQHGLAPQYQAEAYNNLGVLLATSGDLKGAVTQFEQAVRIRPDFADARKNLNTALTQSGRNRH